MIPSQSSFLLLLLPAACLAVPACQRAEQAGDVQEIPRLERPEYTAVRRLIHNRKKEEAAMEGRFFAFHQEVNWITLTSCCRCTRATRTWPP